jgi:phosphatidate phosphatase APP1
LLGDSGEGDPEIYGAVARQSPEQVVGIWIRRVVGRPLSDDRLRRVFRDLRPDIWRVFEAAEELPTTLAHLTMPH